MSKEITDQVIRDIYEPGGVRFSCGSSPELQCGHNAVMNKFKVLCSVGR